MERCLKRFSKASSSGTRPGRSPALFAIAKVCLKKPKEERSSSTRSAKWRRRCRSSSCESCRSTTIRRVGENKERHIDVRVLAASNKDLGTAVKNGTFRDDLYFRVRVIELVIPPLRERPDDILPLARFFMNRLAEKLGLPDLQLDASCLDLLQRYPWPGNVRELENALERAAVLSEEGRVRPEGLPPSIRGLEPSVDDSVYRSMRTLEEIELDHIRRVLRHTQGNRSEAAKILGIGATTLWRRLKETEPEPDG